VSFEFVVIGSTTAGAAALGFKLWVIWPELN